ncbi:hypothetical protein ZEAMMB73_Zm00001d029986 [Zea mays]|uniref:Uncharacterized protein n=1 Tax=Zea mays TaxID=4577 RepID=A0A1D6K8T6_MAIZE|nr:hypothetical protein ZEAMMB73_Zm00001d029986 [Zea mays]
MPPLPGTLISTGARPSSSFNHGRRPLLPIAATPSPSPPLISPSLHLSFQPWMPPLPGTLISTGARPSSSFNHGRRPLLPIAGQRPISSTSQLPVPSLSHEPLSSFSMASTWGSPLQPRLAGSPQGAGMLLPIHRATSWCLLSS